MVLIRSYSKKKSNLRNVLLLLATVFFDRFHVLKFLPFPLAVTLPVLFFVVASQDYLIPIWIIFTIGVLNDLLSGSAVGQTTIPFLTVYIFIAHYRNILRGSDLGVQWIFLAGGVIIFTLTEWFLICLINQTCTSLWPALKLNGLSVLFYPIIFFLLKKLLKADMTHAT